MTIADPPFAPLVVAVPPLEQGDRLDQAEFHRRYLAMPPGTRAELVGGVVYMPSPVGRVHGIQHKAGIYWLGHYERYTPGVEAIDNGTTVLADDSEPQPDISLRIMHGGRTTITARGYVANCPELVFEVASSSESYDLHAKRLDYERYGAEEYVAAIVRASRVVWFRRIGDRLVEIPPDADGVYRSTAFPGLWLDPAALLSGDLNRLATVVEQGVASAEHGAFAAELLQRQPI